MGKINIYIILFIFAFSACTGSFVTATSNETEEGMPAKEARKKPAISDREAKAYELFEEILDLTETQDIQTVLPQIEILYINIIREYPDTAIAQECYWRLISLYVKNNVPPEYEKAEALYSEFLKKYPRSVITTLIEDTLAKIYHKNKKWDKILKIYPDAASKFNEKDEHPNPSPVFMYAEAKYNLGDLAEAEKAYKIIEKYFPKSKMAPATKERLEEIKKRKEKADTPDAE
ncbi:MAG: hypothetical protein A2Y97_07540 [Nitrospirae bacterium RBG_13_39_12]|nr:MAG: hypothetical protein A2Y97_07540 [Nitrospirae bacterium RBG_13_39_12]